ncbi:MAG: arginine N-succinyltransferase [Bradymonadales bacterium]|nr:MAG: arginine N-succinyltransferase [Bradymonadales bacterium]
MFVVRAAEQRDLESLLELAKSLGTAGNLPQEPSEMLSLISHSEASFAGQEKDKSKAVYLFVLEDLEQNASVGASLVFAKHGTADSPHTYLQVIEKTQRDSGSGIEIKHQLLRFEFDEDGPTEIGGLILNPKFRSKPKALGKLLSYGRFIYMGMFPERFEERVIAELLPPFNPDGTSELWEAFGQRFTGLDYQEADRRSRVDKEFIKNLFPSEDVYTRLFSKKAQAAIGKTGESTRAAQVLLERIGFSYLNAVDPFDGGPHLEAKLKEITLIKRLESLRASSEASRSGGTRSLMGWTSGGKFFCGLCQKKQRDAHSIQLDEESLGLLAKMRPDHERVFVVTLPY